MFNCHPRSKAAMTSQLDFRNIRADFPNGQRGAFEELVCQLARRASLSPSTFKRVEGSGGDGGVECIVTTDAGVIGYQAKFYTQVGGINWAAVDGSVQTALLLYPNLIRYVIAMPCDFTGRKNLNSGRVSEGAWGAWEKYRQKWEAQAVKEARHVEFIPWTEFSLREQLIQTNAEGLRAYWFGEIEFSAGWFKQHAESAIASLDERYSPQDHIDVHLQDIFDVLIKHPRAIAALEERFSDLRTKSLPTFPEDNSPQELLKAADDGLTRILECETELGDESWQTWDQAKWSASMAAARKALAELRKWCEQGANRLEYQLHRLIKVQAALTSLDAAVEKSVLSFGRTTSILFHGTAGTGKSHLLARVADCSINEERPVVLWVGQQLRDQPLWPQLLLRLGLPTATPEQFLDALEAAAQTKRTRALLLVDAINEGAGARLWRSEIAEFLAKVRRYPSVVVVLSCRSEYLNYLIPKGISKGLQFVEVRGFETEDEQAAAARVYLDKRGISRPATPWLAPEFVNPLFLRSCCNALERAGLREFPKGLAGAKAIMGFYLDSIGRNLGIGRDGSDELLGPMKRSLAELARTMAFERHSYTKFQKANSVISESFSPYLPPEGLTWLDVLRRNGLIRLDPNPSLDGAKDSFEDVDVVRFSFQRFQDHLMADALLADIADIKTAFCDDGLLSFVRTQREFEWEWRGLVEAFAIQVPERFGRELVDVLPGGMRQWWSVYFAQDSFLESIRWRSAGAFNNRTLELFNQLSAASDSRFSLLIELSASIGHPWNAELIHRNLKPKPMHTRDAFWSNRLNIECSDDHHSVQRLIDWCLRPEIKLADPRTVSLCSITLAWLFTLSNRPVRDRATKALANLLVGDSRLFGELLAKFDGVDDLYVWERIFEAAYGAACNDPNGERLREYARLAAERLFLADSVPENLLLRDCGRGLIQLAEHSGVLPPEFPLERCHPPYGSRLPSFTATLAQVEELAKKARDNAILRSCNTWGDFGRYQIEPAVRHFTTSRLKGSSPVTGEKLFNEFLRAVVQPFPDRRDAWRVLQKASAPDIRIIFTDSSRSDQTPEVRSPDEGRRRQIALIAAERAFQGLLTEDEEQRYFRNARAYLNLGNRKATPDHRRIDTEQAQLWVARRAYKLGRALNEFPWSRGSIYDDRSRPRLERLGKKYQWIALDELVCKLADNYWMSEYGGDTRQYQYPPDAGFFRDIDPTIILSEPSPAPAHWMVAPKIIVEPQDSDSVWPFTIERGSELEQLTTRVDAEGSLWLTAYEHQNAESLMENRGDFESTRSHRREEFRFVCLVIVHQKDRNEFVQSVAKTRTLDIHSWGPREFTDGPYLLEAHWRPTWQLDTWETDEWNGCTAPRAFPVSDYHWESHLDLTLPGGHRELLPSPWLMRKLGLRKNLQLGGKYHDSHGEVRFMYGRRGMDGTVALFKKDWFTAYLERESLEPVWLYLNERNSIIGDMCGAWRRTEGVAWMEGNAVRAKTWHHDQTRKR
jgi:hypothetical protein